MRSRHQIFCQSQPVAVPLTHQAQEPKNVAASVKTDAPSGWSVKWDRNQWERLKAKLRRFDRRNHHEIYLRYLNIIYDIYI